MLEMLCVNMYTFHKCSEKRFSTFMIVFVLGVFTALFIWSLDLLIGKMILPGNGIFLFCGVAYLIPLMILYRQSVRYSIAIMCSSWIYTILVYALSIQIAEIISQGKESYLFAVQTALYAITIRPFFRFVAEKFMYITENADRKSKNLLFWFGVSWCLFFILMNYLLVFNMPILANSATKILILCVSAANAFMTYQIFYSFRRESRNALEFERTLRLDALTGLKNRTAFFEDARDLIAGGKPFTIFFIDLDNFKSVNDDYGHVMGDLYLKRFSKSFSTVFSAFGTFYRISGDEFVFLHINGKFDQLIHQKIERFDMRVYDGVPFKGFSMGSASYPDDGQDLNTLVAVADKQMYKEKNVRCGRRKSSPCVAENN